MRERIDENNVRLGSLAQEVDALRNSIPQGPAAIATDPNAPPPQHVRLPRRAHRNAHRGRLHAAAGGCGRAAGQPRRRHVARAVVGHGLL